MFYVNENMKNLYRVKSQETRKDMLRLDMNENPEGLPDEFVNRVRCKITPEFLSMYPEKGSLLALLAGHNQISEASISLTNGSDEAMRLVFETFGCPGKEAITVDPTFEMYDVYCNMFGMKHRGIAYDDDLTVDVDKILADITEETGLVILLNPNSPIGTTYSVGETECIVEKAGQMGAMVIIDEAYHYFHKDSKINLIHKYDNVLILRTFSKLFSLAACRLGYAAGNPELITYLENAESTYNVNAVALLFAEEILKNPQLIEELQAVEKEGHAYLLEELEKAGYEYRSLEGNYVLIKPNKTPAQVYNKLYEQGILIKYYKRGILTDWIRITTGSRTVMEQFWERFVFVELTENKVIR